MSYFLSANQKTSLVSMRLKESDQKQQSVDIENVFDNTQTKIMRCLSWTRNSNFERDEMIQNKLNKIFIQDCPISMQTFT